MHHRTRTQRPLCLATAIAAAALTTGLTAPAANAASVTATLNNVSPAQIVSINYNGNSLGAAYAGQINWTGNAPNAAPLAGAFSSFCIDLTQDVYIGGTYTYQTADLLHSPNPLPPTAPIAATGMGADNARYVENLYSLYWNAAMTNDQGAAFQLAIWEILFDTNASDVKTGMFNVGASAGNTVANLANSYVAGARTNDTHTFAYDFIALTSADVQDQLVIGGLRPNDPGDPGRLTPVPTPAAAFGALPLLGALAANRRRRGD